MAELAETIAAAEDDRLDQAEGLVRAFCGWHIARNRTDMFRQPNLTGTLLLPSLYVTAVTSFVVGELELVPGEHYTFTQAGVVQLPLCGWGTYSWSPGSGEVVITYQHGYPEVPPDITAVVQGAAQRAIDNPGSRMSMVRGPFTDIYGTVSPGSSLTAMALTGPDHGTLAPYRLPARP